jgi:hypothetical protein
MTKRRPPDTLEAAVAAIIGALGHQGAAEVVERGTSVLYAWSDPDRREGIGVREACVRPSVVAPRTIRSARPIPRV